MCFRVAAAVVAFVAVLGLAPAPASGQTFTGSVVGHVLDPQHAVIANAAVTLNSLDRSFEWGTTTDPKGEYSFPLVPPGTFLPYRLSLSKWWSQPRFVPI